jgi:sporulation protein YlmC with PRC-barrel domain
MRDHEFDIVYRLLDDDIVDSDGRRCGRVDDIELEGEPGKPTYIAAILTGPGAWQRRFPRRLRPLAKRIFSDSMQRVPWKEVRDISDVLNLKRPGKELGLGKGDDAVGAVIEKLPGA